MIYKRKKRSVISTSPKWRGASPSPKKEVAPEAVPSMEEAVSTRLQEEAQTSRTHLGLLRANLVPRVKGESAERKKSGLLEKYRARNASAPVVTSTGATELQPGRLVVVQ